MKIINKTHQMSRVILLLLFSVITFGLQAQDGRCPMPSPNSAAQPDNHRPPFSPQEYMRKEEAFITREAKLTTAEAAYFFPLFHQNNQKQRELSDRIRDLVQSARHQNLTEEQYSALLKQIEKLKLAKLKLEISYHQSYHKFLSYKKILAVEDADSRFERHMLRQMFKNRDRN